MGIYSYTIALPFKRNNIMSKLIIALSLAAVFGLNSLVEPDCRTDNGKYIDNCAIIDGKEVISTN